MRRFKDRVDAGQQLARRLHRYSGREDALVLALPRGGVPVAAQIAGALDLPLDVLIVRKLGAPGQPELALGAIASGGAVVMNDDVCAYFAGCSHDALADRSAMDAIAQRETEELYRREFAFRGNRPPLCVGDRLAIVVDDGAATGATMRAAVRALRLLGAKQIVATVPVASAQSAQLLAAEADEFVCLETPQDFFAVGQWYAKFEQTTDEEVSSLLSQFRLNGHRGRAPL